LKYLQKPSMMVQHDDCVVCWQVYNYNTHQQHHTENPKLCIFGLQLVPYAAWGLICSMSCFQLSMQQLALEVATVSHAAGTCCNKHAVPVTLDGLTTLVQVSALGVSPAINCFRVPLPPPTSLNDATTASACSWGNKACQQRCSSLLQSKLLLYQKFA